MNDTAQRIHSIRRLVWMLGIVNVVALLLLFTIPPYILATEVARSSEIRSQAIQTENEQFLLQSVDGLRKYLYTASIWFVVLLITQTVTFVIIDRRLGRELQIGSEPSESPA